MSGIIWEGRRVCGNINRLTSVLVYIEHIRYEADTSGIWCATEHLSTFGILLAVSSESQLQI